MSWYAQQHGNDYLEILLITERIKFWEWDPLLFEAYWRKNSDLGAVVIPAWYRMGYQTRDVTSMPYTEALVASIRELHAMVGNAVTEGRYIAFGTGSTQLINAVIQSCTPGSGESHSCGIQSSVLQRKQTFTSLTRRYFLQAIFGFNKFPPIICTSSENTVCLPNLGFVQICAQRKECFCCRLITRKQNISNHLSTVSQENPIARWDNKDLLKLR